MATTIKQGTIVTAGETYVADILVEDGVIRQIGADLQPKPGEVIDAKGKYVFPGGIETHCHLIMRTAGIHEVDDYDTAFVAAACGGTTTVIDYAVQRRPYGLLDTLHRWQGLAAGKAPIDYSFHVGIVDSSEASLAEMPGVAEEGAPSFKLWMAYRGSPLNVDDTSIYAVMDKARDCGGLTLIHCENADLAHVISNRLIAQGKKEPIHTALSRPPLVEAEAVSRAIDIAELTGAPLYIPHLSSKEALERARAGRARGLPVYVETCPQYLALSADNLRAPGREGLKYVNFPPIRERENQEYLWRGLASGDIQTIGTDHVNRLLEDKIAAQGEGFPIPGMPGIETRLMVVYTAGVLTGKLSLNRFVAVTSTNAAKIFGLFPQKGTIAIGSDADLVVWDPKAELTLGVKTLHQPGDHNPFEGFQAKGMPLVVLSRGEVVVRDRNFVGRLGAGRFLKRKPFQRPA